MKLWWFGSQHWSNARYWQFWEHPKHNPSQLIQTTAHLCVPRVTQTQRSTQTCLSSLQTVCHLPSLPLSKDDTCRRTWRSAGGWWQVKRHVGRLQMDCLGCSGLCCQVWLPGFRKTVEGDGELPEIKEKWENWSKTIRGLKSKNTTNTASYCSHHYNFAKCCYGLLGSWGGGDFLSRNTPSPLFSEREMLQFQISTRFKGWLDSFSLVCL